MQMSLSGLWIRDIPTPPHLPSSSAFVNAHPFTPTPLSSPSPSAAHSLSRLQAYIPDYTGHVPRLRQTFGMSCLRASDSLGRTVAKPEQRTGDLQKLSYVQDGQRKLGLTRGVQLLGTGFTATCTSTGKEKLQDNVDADVYVQGTKVNLKAYYDTCRAHNFQNLLIKAGNRALHRPNKHPHAQIPRIRTISLVVLKDLLNRLLSLDQPKGC